MTDYSRHSLDDLIDVITAWPVGMPVRAMERVLAMGESTVPPLVEALERWRNDESRDLLWPVVLLGEMRSPSGVQTLIDLVLQTDNQEMAQAALEGVAKIGVPALPALTQLATASDPVVRIHVYCALGGIRDDRAFSMLAQALARDHGLGDVLAQALCDQGKTEAIPILYDAYCNCAPWQRTRFEEAIHNIHFGRTDPTLWTVNWRVRYRRDPALGGFALSWRATFVLLRHHRDKISKEVSPEVRSLEEIFEHGAVSEASETCQHCGEPIEEPTGLPVCPEIAVGAVLQQVRFLSSARQDGVDNIFDLFDSLDDMSWQHHEKPELLKAREPERWRELAQDLDIHRRTCCWLVEQGIEDISGAKALLLAKAVELADRFGDPERLLSPAVQTQRTPSKVGRNDPCPCGSGQKYKRCCLGKG
jgi:HEAT repeat protein